MHSAMLTGHRHLSRILLALTALGLSVLGPAAQAQPGTLAVVEERAGSSRASAAALLTQADAATKDKDFARADALYRKAWQDPMQRRRAATSLTALHKTPGFKLTTDSDAIKTALAQLGPGFTRHETGHFVILSNCDLRWTQARGELLERTRSQFNRVADRLALDAVPPRNKLLCILINSRDAYLAFATTHDKLKAMWIAGYYSTRSNRIVFYNDTTGPEYEAARRELDRARADVKDARDKAAKAERDGNPGLAQRLNAAADDLESRIKSEDGRLSDLATDASTAKTIHEAIHLLAFNSGVQSADRDYPFWLSEGLAIAFETENPKAAFGPDRSSSRTRLERYKQLLAEGKIKPLSELITITDASNCDAAAAEALYCQSSAFFSYLYGKNAPAIGRYIRAINDGAPGRVSDSQQLALFVSSFGDPGAIDPRLGVK